MKAVLITALLFTLASAPVLPAAPRQDTADREVQALMLAIKLLEEKPFDAKAKDVRASALKWIIDTEKVSVTICSLILKEVPERYTYKAELLTQYTIGMAVYKLSQPKDSKAPIDEDAAQLAGVESALTAYQAIVKERPTAKEPFLDGLTAKRTAGELAPFVQKNNCDGEGRRVRFQ